MGQQTIESAANALVLYLRELYPLVSGEPPSQLTELQQHALGTPDWLLPFRQLAPELVKVFGPGGMLHPDNIDEPGAIASLWCWRGIWYRTEFSTHHDMFFNSYDDWKATYRQLRSTTEVENTIGGPNRYFCNTQAFGNATTRSVKFAKTYFQEESNWLALFNDKDYDAKLPYIEAYNFTQKKKEKLKVLPQIGPLVGMLITSDLVYAGKVLEPTVEEFAILVAKLNKGAVSCLQDLSLLSDRDNTSDVVSTFTLLYNSVHDALTDEERAGMVFDVIMFEHALCKYQRYYRPRIIRY